MKHRLYRVRVKKPDGKEAMYIVKAWTAAEAAQKQAGKGRVFSVKFEGERKV